jgi:hypothetical protein
MPLIFKIKRLLLLIVLQWVVLCNAQYYYIGGRDLESIKYDNVKCIDVKLETIDFKSGFYKLSYMFLSQQNETIIINYRCNKFNTGILYKNMNDTTLFGFMKDSIYSINLTSQCLTEDEDEGRHRVGYYYRYVKFDEQVCNLFYPDSFNKNLALQETEFLANKKPRASSFVDMNNKVYDLYTPQFGHLPPNYLLPKEVYPYYVIKNGAMVKNSEAPLSVKEYCVNNARKSDSINEECRNVFNQVGPFLLIKDGGKIKFMLYKNENQSNKCNRYDYSFYINGKYINHQPNTDDSLYNHYLMKYEPIIKNSHFINIFKLFAESDYQMIDCHRSAEGVFLGMLPDPNSNCKILGILYHHSSKKIKDQFIYHMLKNKYVVSLKNEYQFDFSISLIQN